MTQVHDRYSKTFAAMLEEFTVINWRALTALNVDGYVQPRPGVFILAHQSMHDANRVKQPYYFGVSGDLQAELAAQVEPQDGELAKQAQRGNRWFRVVYGNDSNLAELLGDVKERWAELGKDYEAHAHGSPALTQKADDGGEH
ncbi:MAG: hypothetical protein M3R04_04075 [bacterium]|nr:hypothetical protein [bacterium]